MIGFRSPLPPLGLSAPAQADVGFNSPLFILGLAATGTNVVFAPTISTGADGTKGVYLRLPNFHAIVRAVPPSLSTNLNFNIDRTVVKVKSFTHSLSYGTATNIDTVRIIATSLALTLSASSVLKVLSLASEFIANPLSLSTEMNVGLSLDEAKLLAVLLSPSVSVDSRWNRLEEEEWIIR